MGINVVSLFDGMSCGMLALERAGVVVDNYYASEIDKWAIKVSKDNFPFVIQVGDVTKIKYCNGKLYTESGEYDVSKIDLLIGGSPCQGFSMAGNMLAFDDPRSMLYFEYERILKEIQTDNPNAKFLLENVKMKQEFKDSISSRLGVQPVAINSNLVSAQNRYRLYWTNIDGVTIPVDKKIYLKDICEEAVHEKYYIKDGRLAWLKNFGELKEKDGYVAFNPDKAKCLTVRGEPSWNTTYVTGNTCRGRLVDDKYVQQYDFSSHDKSPCLTTVQKDSYIGTCILQWPHGSNKGGIRAIDGKSPAMTTSSWESNNLLLNSGVVRRLTPEECEKLQTVPVGYTSCVSDTQRYRMLGNGWTVDVISHIFSFADFNKGY